MKTALITGILGQDGAYLTKFLLDKGYTVYGIIPRRANQSRENLEYLGVSDKVNFVFGDVTDLASLMSAIEEAQPDEFYNLAAMSFVGSSWAEPVLTSQVNALGVLNCLEAIKKTAKDCKFYQASTSEMFGLQMDADKFQRETTPLIPRSPYGVAKLFGHQMVRNYRESYGMFACAGILFNHESPLRGLEFVTRKITDGIAQIVTGKSDHITLGNLDSWRDWGFAGDYVEAMWLMLQQDEPDDYVIATGQTHSIHEFLTSAFLEIGVIDFSPFVKKDPRFMRPAELTYLKGDPSKAKEKLGWELRTSFDDLVKCMVEADIARYS